MFQSAPTSFKMPIATSEHFLAQRTSDFLPSRLSASTSLERRAAPAASTTVRVTWRLGNRVDNVGIAMPFAPSPSHHHFYGWDKATKMGGLWHCYTNIIHSVLRYVSRPHPPTVAVSFAMDQLERR